VKEGADSEVDLMLFENKNFAHIRDMMNETPLHWAAKRGYDKMVQLLCKYGGDIFVKDLAGRTPKDVALLNGHKPLATWLLYEEEKIKRDLKIMAKQLELKEAREHEHKEQEHKEHESQSNTPQNHD